ncbi:hypothetical protein REPUB_Repub07fG0107800 [Reevesia pubescens]
MDVKPFLHKHYLFFDHYNNHGATCDKCNQKIDRWAYSCESCNFWLHSSCAEQQLPSQISHAAHHQHPLTLYYDVENFVCKGCFTLSRGHRYICEDCNFNIEILCAASYTKVDDALEKQGQRSDGRYTKTNHFIHYDYLTLCKYRKVKSDHYSCRWCDKFLSGMCYGCFDCFEEFFVHESCLLSIPTTISKHRFHPTHPLYIQTKVDNFETRCNACKDEISGCGGYHCRKCDFWLHFLCTRHQPSLKHEFHEHSLSYFQMKLSPVAFKCNMCDKQICAKYETAAFYRCVPCDVNLHLKCVPIHPTTRHIYHKHALKFIDTLIEDDSGEYYCDICEEERNPKHPIYYCKQCKYVAHIQCAVNMVDGKALIPKLMEQEEEADKDNAESQTQPEIEHFDHRHSLQFFEVIEKVENLLCKACNFEITSQAYGCESCKYYLHKTCAKLSHEVLHPLHPAHALKLITNTDTFLCHHCRDFTVGFIYMCYLCDFMLDVKCAISITPKSESQRLEEIERDSKLCFFSRDHKLFFFNFRHEPHQDFNCSLCCLPILGPTYNCVDCHYVLHESCLVFPWEIQLPVLSGKPLHPLVTDEGYITYRCRACGCTLETHGISYSYRQHRYDLNFHLRCVNSLRRALESESHQHPLFYFGTECQESFANMNDFSADTFFECNACNEPFSRAPFYRCLMCDINFHLKCVPIPHFIKSNCHIHPFILKDYFVEDDSGEYYCDVCEEERHPNDHVYYCEECRGLFVAHIECVLNQVNIYDLF